MKKFILALFILGIGLFSISFADTTECVDSPGGPSSCKQEGGGGETPADETPADGTPSEDPKKKETDMDKAVNTKDDACLRGVGSGCFDVDELLFPGSPITQLNKRRTVMSITQDVAYGAMVMVGTVLTVVIIYCGLMYIFAARGGENTSNYKKGLENAAIGAILVRGAYAIVRLIQYIAKG